MSRKPFKKGAPPERDFGEDGPDIIRGAKNNDLGEVKTALTYDWANITKKDVVTGMTALHYAVALGNHNMAQFLLRCEGVDLRTKDRFGRDVLDTAIECGHPKIVEAVFARLNQIHT